MIIADRKASADDAARCAAPQDRRVDTFRLFDGGIDKTLDLFAVGDLCIGRGIVAKAGPKAAA